MAEHLIVNAHDVDELLREHNLIKLVSASILGAGIFWVAIERVPFDQLVFGDLVLRNDGSVKKLKLKTAACWVSHDRGSYDFERIFPEDYRGRIAKIYQVL